ncbi:MAG: glycyl-radical enzyme activating protein [Spirochaetales bacterium]|nr:glycyl-radical enzyme activating protein [Spirochaetales bacterium]
MNVFEIERYATEDGPGIRTVIFLKGCNLRCVWCQNPESQDSRAQVMYYQQKCVGCRKCVEACPENAIYFDKQYGYVTDHAKCTVCGACVDACFYDARKIIGKEYSVEELFKEIVRDAGFYKESGGGVTFSGGEPMLQSDEISELAQLLKQEGIHTSIETAGAVIWDRFESLLSYIDLFYYDVKHIDSEAHRKYTGAPNELILENLKVLSRRHEHVIVRIPVVPGVNNSSEILKRIYQFLAEETNIKRVELLPYHRLGMGKYAGLGMEYLMGDTESLAEEDCYPFAEIGKQYDLRVSVGAE